MSEDIDLDDLPEPQACWDDDGIWRSAGCWHNARMALLESPPIYSPMFYRPDQLDRNAQYAWASGAEWATCWILALALMGEAIRQSQNEKRYPDPMWNT